MTKPVRRGPDDTAVLNKSVQAGRIGAAWDLRLDVLEDGEV